MNTFCKMEDNPKALREELESTRDYCFKFSKHADVLKELLSEEVESNNEMRKLVNHAQCESREWRRKYDELREIIAELQPGQRLTKEVLNKLNQI